MNLKKTHIRTHTHTNTHTHLHIYITTLRGPHEDRYSLDHSKNDYLTWSVGR